MSRASSTTTSLETHVRSWAASSRPKISSLWKLLRTRRLSAVQSGRRRRKRRTAERSTNDGEVQKHFPSRERLFRAAAANIRHDWRANGHRCGRPVQRQLPLRMGQLRLRRAVREAELTAPGFCGNTGIGSAPRHSGWWRPRGGSLSRPAYPRASRGGRGETPREEEG